MPDVDERRDEIREGDSPVADDLCGSSKETDASGNAAEASGFKSHRPHHAICVARKRFRGKHNISFRIAPPWTQMRAFSLTIMRDPYAGFS